MGIRDKEKDIDVLNVADRSVPSIRAREPGVRTGCGEYVILKKVPYFSREFHGKLGSVF